MYLLVVTSLGYVTLSPYPAQVDPMLWSNLHNALFITFSRPVFILSLMLLIALVTTSDNNLLMRILSHNVWCPLAKLSYLVYLVFPIVTSLLISSLSMSLVLSFFTMFCLIAFSLISSHAVAFVVHIALEQPIAQLLK